MRRAVSGFAVTGLCLSILVALAVMLAGLGSRWGWWHFRTGFMLLRWGAVGGLAAAAVSLTGCILAVLRRSLGLAWLASVGLAIGLVVFGVPWQWKKTAQSVPPIHDISTDTENPPSFVAILALRHDAPNPVEHGGPEIAAQQKAAYPAVVPLILGLPSAQAFERAHEAARAMGWEIVEADSGEGRIEATDTTFWFGFKDDIVIRVAPADGKSRIDVRSVSRVGKSDVGTNARRIVRYLRKLTVSML